MNIHRIRIADTESNRSSLFWKNHIGKDGVWTATSDDGLCDIAFDDPPVVVDGVLRERFDVLGPVTPVRPKIDWSRFLRRMETTGIILGVIAILVVVYWILR